MHYTNELDALALEYKRDHRTARGNLNIANLINNPAASGKCRVFGLLFTKEVRNLGSTEFSVPFDYCPDPVMIGGNPVQTLP